MTQPQGGRAFRMIGGAHGMISGRAHGVISDSAHGWSAEFLTYAPVVRITSGGTAHPGTQLRPPGLQRQPVLAVPNWMTAAIEASGYGHQSTVRPGTAAVGVRDEKVNARETPP